MTSNYTFTAKKSQDKIAAVLQAIRRKPRTVAYIAGLLNVSDSNVSRFIRYLHENKLIYQSQWLQTEKGRCAVWALGPGSASHKPKYIRKRKVGGAEERRAKALKDFNKTFVAQPVARDWSVQAFFGPAYVGLNAELRGMA